MITNDEAVELLDYIAMNDLDAYDAGLYEDELPY
jgi:hypothetical protein